MHRFDICNKVANVAIAAVGTVIGALIQPRADGRKEVSECARGIPIAEKLRGGPVLAVGLLLIAAAVGGFSVSRYFVGHSDRKLSVGRGAPQMPFQQITAMAQRLERVTLRDHAVSGRAADGRVTAEDVSVTTTVGPRLGLPIIAFDWVPTCAAADASRLTLCAGVPASAAVAQMIRYASPEESRRAWHDSRVAVGESVGSVHFPGKPLERAEIDGQSGPVRFLAPGTTNTPTACASS